MKSTMIKTLLYVFALLTCLAVVSAAITINGGSAVQIGSDSTAKSNPNHETESEQEKYGDRTFSVAGDPNKNISSVVISSISPASPFTNGTKGSTAKDNENKLLITGNSNVDGDKKSAQMTLRARIPEGLDAVDADLNPSAFQVATLQIRVFYEDGTTEVGTVNLNMQTENNLEISDANINFAGRTEDVSDGDEVDNVKPGDSISMDIECTNRFSDREDVDIEDIQAAVVIDDKDLDVDEDDDLSDLGADDEDAATLSFDIEDDTDAGTFNAVLTCEGNDEFGARHGELFEVDIKVERETHDLQIQTAELSPSIITCSRPTTSLRLDVTNIGKRDEDDVVVTVDAAELDYSERATVDTMDKDDSLSKTFTINVPADTPAGDYVVDIKTYYDSTRLSDTEALTLTVPDCKAGTDTTGKTPVVVPTTKPTETQTPDLEEIKRQERQKVLDEIKKQQQEEEVETTTPQPPVTNPDDLFEEEIVEEVDLGPYIAGLVIAIIVVLAVGIFAVVKATKRE